MFFEIIHIHALLGKIWQSIEQAKKRGLIQFGTIPKMGQISAFTKHMVR